MPHPCHVFVTYVIFLLLPCTAMAQRAESGDVASTVRDLWALKSTDGRSHEVQAIALGRAEDTDLVYVVERLSDPLLPGATQATDVECLLWTLDVNGQVLHKESITKLVDLEPPRVTIVPLPAPQEGAIIIGMFGDRFEWSLRRVNRAGKIAEHVKLINGGTFDAAVLLPDMTGLLLAGQQDLIANVWKVDLDGNVLWKKTYDVKAVGAEAKAEDTKANPDTKSIAQFCSIALTDDQGGFVAAGDFGEINKFGFGQRSVWLVRCDEAGRVLSETTFPGRAPSICSLGKEQLAVVYDTGSAMELDGHMRVVDRQLKEQWEKKAEFTSFLFDKPAISPVLSDRGFVLAGCNMVFDKEKNSMRRECQFDQYDVNRQIVSSASIPVARDTFLFTRIVCGADRAYVACQTNGRGPYDAKESSVFEIHLRKHDQ